MLRFKLDLAAFDQRFRSPFWVFERDRIRQNTILDYARSILAKYRLSEKYPLIYLDEAIIPHTESPEIIRDGDLIRFMPSRTNSSGMDQSKESQMALLPYNQSALLLETYPSQTSITVPTKTCRQQPAASTNNDTTESLIETFYENQRRRQNRSVATESNQNEAETNLEDECDEEGTGNSRKRRKRGPRRRVRTKRNIADSDTEEQNTSEMQAEDGAPSAEVEQHPTNNPTHLTKTALDLTQATGGGSSSHSVSEQQNGRCSKQKKDECMQDTIKSERQQSKTRSYEEDLIEPIAQRPTPVAKRVNKSGEIAENAISEESVTPGPLSSNGPPMKKMSARKAAKRSYGVGDVLRMLQSDNGDKGQSASPDTVEDAHPDVETSTNNVEVPKRHYTTEEPTAEPSKPTSSQDDSQPSDLTTARVALRHHDSSQNSSRSVTIDSVHVGSRLVAGLSLFSEADMGVRYFDNVTLSVTHLNIAKKQLYVKLERGFLPKEYRDCNFKTDWSLLENAQLVSSP